MNPRRSLLPVMVLAAGLTISPARALTVFDPSNYAQNVLQAARALEQINNQITSLANEARMLANQARNLESLPTSTLSQLQSSILRTQSLIAQAQNLAYDVQQIEAAYSSSYGPASTSTSDAALVATAQDRWQTSVGAFEDSLKTQAGVVGNIPSNSDAMATLVSSSQSATGALQAAQARADALEQARTASTEAQGQEQYRRFSTRSGYIPHDVTMFGSE